MRARVSVWVSVWVRVWARVRRASEGIPRCFQWCTACMIHCTEAWGGGSRLGTCLTESSVAASAQARECILPGRG